MAAARRRCVAGGHTHDGHARTHLGHGLFCEGQALTAACRAACIAQTDHYKEGITYAVQTLSRRAPHAALYIDAAHGGWMGYEVRPHMRDPPRVGPPTPDTAFARPLLLSRPLPCAQSALPLTDTHGAALACKFTRCRRLTPSRVPCSDAAPFVSLVQGNAGAFSDLIISLDIMHLIRGFSTNVANYQVRAAGWCN
eukprot:5588869-Prymnesium_polylepis.1